MTSQMSFHTEIWKLNKKKYFCLFQDASVKQIDVPSFSGAFGILPNHVPSLVNKTKQIFDYCSNAINMTNKYSNGNPKEIMVVNWYDSDIGS